MNLRVATPLYTGNYRHIMDCFVKVEINLNRDNNNIVETQGIVFGNLRAGFVGVILPKFKINKDVETIRNITIFSNLNNKEFEFGIKNALALDETQNLFFIELKDLELKEVKGQCIIVDKERVYNPIELENLKYCDRDDFQNRIYRSQNSNPYFCSFIKGISQYAIQNYVYSILDDSPYHSRYRQYTFSFINLLDIELYNGSPFIIENYNGNPKIGGIVVSEPVDFNFEKIISLKNTGLLVETEEIYNLIDNL